MVDTREKISGIRIVGWSGDNGVLIAGNKDVVEDNNFRGGGGESPILEQVQLYIEDVVGPLEMDSRGQKIWAITWEMSDVKFTRRRNLKDLSANTRRDYLGSQRAKDEAALHGMTVERWYQYAPDLKAFRRKAPARFFGRGVYRAYISRDTNQLTQKERKMLSAHFKRLWKEDHPNWHPPKRKPTLATPTPKAERQAAYAARRKAAAKGRRPR